MSENKLRIPGPLSGVQDVVEQVTEEVVKVAETVEKAIPVDETGLQTLGVDSDLDGKQLRFTVTPKNFDWVTPSNSQEAIDEYDANGNLIQTEVPPVAGFRYKNGTSGCNSFTTEQVATWQTYATGKCALAVGGNNKSKANYSTTFGSHNTNEGINSLIAGTLNYASGIGCAVIGRKSFVTGDASVAVSDSELSYTDALQKLVTALNNPNYKFPKINDATTSANKKLIKEVYDNWGGTFAAGLGNHAFVGGINNIAAGNGTTAIGIRTFAEGQYSTTMGQDTHSVGHFSLAIGNDTLSNGDASVSMGYSTEANGLYSLVGGTNSITNGNNSIAFGEGAITKGRATLSVGDRTEAVGNFSMAIGSLYSVTTDGVTTDTKTTATGNSAIALGRGVQATNEASVAIGRLTQSTGVCSLSGGVESVASGSYAVAYGNGCKATNVQSTAFGYKTTASGQYSFALGTSTLAEGRDAVAFGNMTKAYGVRSTAIGYAALAGTQGVTTNEEECCTSIGYFTTAKGLRGQTVVGACNTPVSNAQFIVGNGVDSTHKSNAFVIYKDGSAELMTQGTEDNSIVLKKTLDDAIANVSTGGNITSLTAADIAFDDPETPTTYIGGATVDEALRTVSSCLIEQLLPNSHWDHTAEMVTYTNDANENITSVKEALDDIYGNSGLSGEQQIGDWTVEYKNGETKKAYGKFIMNALNPQFMDAHNIRCNFPNVDGLGISDSYDYCVFVQFNDGPCNGLMCRYVYASTDGSLIFWSPEELSVDEYGSITDPNGTYADGYISIMIYKQN